MKTDSTFLPCRTTFLGATIALLLAACGADGESAPVDARTPGDADAGGLRDSRTDAATGPPPSSSDPADGGPLADSSSNDSCSLANTAPEIQGHHVAVAPPAMTGGTITDGLYALTDYTSYATSGGTNFPLGAVKETLRIRDQGKTFAVASTLNYPANSTVAGTLVATGNKLSVTYSCGGGHPWETFTATATSVKLAATSNGVTVIGTYERIP